MADGRVRVQITGESGREVVLYRVQPGQSCVLTTSCILAGEAYPATGVTDTEVQAFAIPKPEFDRAMDASAAFRRFVFANLGGRLAEVIERIEEVALQPLDRRLAALLLARAEAGHVAATHQQIAAELGSAREVVSRHLKRLEGRGLVHLARSSVELVDCEGLQALAGDGV